MSRDGSGNYELPNSPVIPGTIISSAHYNTTLEDIKNALTESLPRSGEAPMDAPLKLVDGSPTSPGLSFNAENSGLYRPGAGILGFVVSSGERMRISGSNLIIGRTVDDGVNILQVGGQAKFFSGVIVDGALDVNTGATITGDTSVQNFSFTTGTGNSLVLDTGLVVGGSGISTNGISVSGNQTIVGNLTVGGNLLAAGVAAGPSTFDSIETPSLQVDGASNLTTLNVGSTSNFVGDATFQNIAGASGTFTALNAENANIGAFLTATHINSSGTTSLTTLNVSGTSSLTELHVAGDLTTAAGTATLPTLNSTNFTATTANVGTVNGGVINQTSATGTGEINIGVGRTADGATNLNFRNVAGNSTYNYRLNRGAGVNGSVFYQNTGSGRQQFDNDTSPDFRWQTNATGGITHKFTAPNLTQGADYSVHGQSLSSVGNINFFIQNSAQTTTQNYYSITRNATAGIANHIFRTGGDASVSGSATTAFTISETAVLPALQVQSSYLGTEIAPTYSFNGDNNTGMWRSASDVIDFSAGGVRKLQIDTAKITASVPVIAPQSVSSAAFNAGQIYSTTAGFTLNTGMTIGTYTIYNNSAASITATAGAGLTLRLSGTATTGNRTIAQRGIAMLIVLSSTEYVLAGTAVS